MKHLLILTSLLSLSACGGFFDFSYYDPDKETAEVAPVTDTETPTNAGVTQMTTDLNNVVFNSAGGGEYTFTFDGNGVIDGLSGNGGSWHATRDGNSDYFVDDSTDARYQVKMFGNGHLTYSDFGTITSEGGSEMVFAGGNTDKHAGIYTDSEIVAIQNKEYVSDVTFTGTAVGVVKYNGEPMAETQTNAATLNVNNDTFTLNMPFSSNGDGNFYDVDIIGGYDYKNGNFDDNADKWAVILSGSSNSEEYFFGYLDGVTDGHIDSYGDTGATASEAVGWVHLNGYASDKKTEASFEAAFGVSKFSK